MLPLRDTVPSRRMPLVNWALIALNVLVFLYEVSLPDLALTRLMFHWGVVPTRLTRHLATAWPTLFTSMFLHGGWAHILGNMWVLFIFGDNVEDRMGHGRYLIFYLLSGLAAAFLQVFFSLGSNVPMIGASGAIAGVMGAYMILFPWGRVVTLVPLGFFLTTIELPSVLFLGGWFFLQVFSGLDMSLNGGVAWWAHVGGFLFGMLAVQIFARRRRPQPVRVLYWQEPDDWLW